MARASIHEILDAAQTMRVSARELRARARSAVERAQKARRRFRHLEASVELAAGPKEAKRRVTLRDEALDALKQSLRDLESLRMVSADNAEVGKLKADIRKTLANAG